MPLSASLLARIALVVTVVIPVPALAEEPLVPGHLERRFRAHDVNKNDVIERTETRISDSQFAAMDRDGDSVLSRAEVRADYERRVERARRERQEERERSGRHRRGPVATSTANPRGSSVIGVSLDEKMLLLATA